MVGHELYTFMDGYSWYNQVLVAFEDYYNIVFTTLWGTVWKMTYVFANLLHKCMYVFIDDFSTHISNDDHTTMLKVCFD